MAVTHKLIQTITVTAAGGAASIEFTSIPQTYTDLLVVASVRSAFADAQDNLLIKFNSSTTGFSNRIIRGSGSAVISYSFGGLANHAGFLPASTATASVFGNNSIYIPNYAGNTNKSYSVDSVQENNTTAAYQLLVAGLWNNTSAITSIMIYADQSANLVQYSSASLYGIKNS